MVIVRRCRGFCILGWVGLRLEAPRASSGAVFSTSDSGTLDTSLFGDAVIFLEGSFRLAGDDVLGITADARQKSMVGGALDVGAGVA